MNQQRRNIGVTISKIFIPLVFGACIILGGPAAAIGVAAFASFVFRSLIVSTVIGVAVGAFVESMTSGNSQRPSHHIRNATPHVAPSSLRGFLASSFVNIFPRTSNPAARDFVNTFQRTSNPVAITGRTMHTLTTNSRVKKVVDPTRQKNNPLIFTGQGTVTSTATHINSAKTRPTLRKKIRPGN